MAAKRIMANYPDYGKAPPEYLLSMTETMAALTEEEIAAGRAVCGKVKP